MSNWSSYQFTRKGEQLRAKVEAGKCKLTLTKIKIGNGSVTLGDIKDMNDLKSPQLVLGISSCAVSAEDDRVCEVVGIASSSNVENAFSVTEMGLYANDPDVGEILYLVEIDTSPDDMPNKNAQSPVTLTYQIELVTSNTANVTALVSPAGLVTVKMMSAHRTAAELDHPDGSVTTPKLRDAAVTGVKIADGVIDKKHLAAGVKTLISDAGIAILQRSRAYQVGDIAYHKSLPSWARLECVREGTTAATLPNLTQVRKCGVMVTDGDVIWIVDDVRDGARVGDIIMRPTLRDGYIKANGANVKASEYLRLLAWVQESNMIVTAEQYAQDCSKYVYDAIQDRLTLPNATGRVLMGGERVKSVEAGLPNLEGGIDNLADFFDECSPAESGGLRVVRRTIANNGIGNIADGNRYVGTGITFNASRANSIYGRSTTVQPPALTMIAQIKY